ncbi:MAG TPA: hypothetical protein VJR22_04555 [Candidatus Nitrosotalea sp.]|nr:hypothetical protein [Nitrososphaerota archaeon]HKU33095.1 hypothetical protein [Candidatus Nitrosotalea sp.]
MPSQIINKKALSNLKNWRADCQDMKKALLTESTRETDPSTKILYKFLAASFVNAELISSWIELSFVAINDLGKTVDNIPNRQEFNSIKKELSNITSRRKPTPKG